MSNLIIYRKHALQRMFERAIQSSDIRQVLDEGKIIVSYPDDQPYASRLLLGWCDGRPVHVVAADTPENETIVITVYEPDPALWEPGYERRKP